MKRYLSRIMLFVYFFSLQQEFSTAFNPIEMRPEVTKRIGDAATLSGLTIYQQGITAIQSPGSLGLATTTTINIGSAIIRGCRLTLCLYFCEKIFKALRAPNSSREVPVPVEAAGMALMLNLGLEYWIGSGLGISEAIPRTLAESLGGTPADAASAFLSIVAWRILFAASSSP